MITRVKFANTRRTLNSWIRYKLTYCLKSNMCRISIMFDIVFLSFHFAHCLRGGGGGLKAILPTTLEYSAYTSSNLYSGEKG